MFFHCRTQHKFDASYAYSAPKPSNLNRIPYRPNRDPGMAERASPTAIEKFTDAMNNFLKAKDIAGGLGDTAGIVDSKRSFDSLLPSNFPLPSNQIKFHHT